MEAARPTIAAQQAVRLPALLGLRPAPPSRARGKLRFSPEMPPYASFACWGISCEKLAFGLLPRPASWASKPGNLCAKPFVKRKLSFLQASLARKLPFNQRLGTKGLCFPAFFLSKLRLQESRKAKRVEKIFFY